MNYLENNLPSFDAINKGTLGFSVDPDGNSGIADQSTGLALQVKSMYPWAADVPYEIFNEYVLPYANVNEPRTDWRAMMVPVV